MFPVCDEMPVQSLSGTPSNDVQKRLNYTVVAQDVEEVRNVQSAPAISMVRFLTEREQMGLVPKISIYAERGNDQTQIRLLYMNTVALRVWREMGMHPSEIGTRHRPPQTAFLAFGVPFSE